MSKAEAYYELVRVFHEYQYGCEFNDFIVNVVASFHRFGYEPQDCMTIMHEVLLNACKQPLYGKESHILEGSPSDDWPPR